MIKYCVMSLYNPFASSLSVSHFIIYVFFHKHEFNRMCECGMKSSVWRFFMGSLFHHSERG